MMLTGTLKCAWRGELHSGAGEIFWMSLIAVLIAWSVSPSANPSRRLTDSSSGCVFVGKGGVICNRSATAAQKRALSRCRRKSAMGLQLLKFQAVVTASRHVLIAAARKMRCVGAEVRWRWTLKVLKTAA
jgi:hypothetical protein